MQIKSAHLNYVPCSKDLDNIYAQTKFSFELLAQPYNGYICSNCNEVVIEDMPEMTEEIAASILNEVEAAMFRLILLSK